MYIVSSDLCESGGIMNKVSREDRYNLDTYIVYVLYMVFSGNQNEMRSQ